MADPTLLRPSDETQRQVSTMVTFGVPEEMIAETIALSLSSAALDEILLLTGSVPAVGAGAKPIQLETEDVTDTSL